MIRYVHIGGQIVEDDDSFALFDTVRDQFLTVYPEWGRILRLVPSERDDA